MLRGCARRPTRINRIDGDKFWRVANYGPLPGSLGGGIQTIRPWLEAGRAIIDRQTIHIHDLAAEAEDEFPAPLARSVGIRTVLATPLLREGVPIGTIHDSSNRSTSFLGEADQAPQDLRRPSCHRYRERSAVQGTGERNAELREASSIRRRLPRCSASSAVADRRAAGPRRHRRERGPGLRDR